MDFSQILTTFTKCFSNAGTLITGFAAAVSSFIAFDISTGLGVKAFGFSLNANFSKVKNKGMGFTERFFNSILRGAPIKGTFIAVLKFLQNYGMDILFCGILAVLIVIGFRYLITYITHSAFFDKKR